MIRRFKTRFLLTMGLTSLLSSVLLLAVFAGLLPDRSSAIMTSRATLAEALAAGTSAFIAQSQVEQAQAVLAFVVERDADLLSAAVRQADGKPVIVVGDHLDHWHATDGQRSTESQIVVPIFAGQTKWGVMELRFTVLRPDAWWAFLMDPRLHLIAAVTLMSFIGFYFYLGRSLKELDPSRAVPGRVRTALDTMAEGLLVLDAGGRIMLANQAFSLVTGDPAEKLIGREASMFAWHDLEGRAMAPKALPWAQAVSDGQAVRNARIALADKSERMRSFLVNCSPVMGTGSKHAGVLISFDDVTELQEKEVALRFAKSEADSANRAKSEFLANMSHEIRTPMNAILGFTDLLRRGYHKSDAELRAHLNTIHASGAHLLELINDILDLSKVESGRLEVERIPCEPYVIVQEVLNVLGGKAREKGISLEVQCAGRIPVTIESDPVRLRQVVTNLVGNAIKFTQKGGVTVVLGVQRQKERTMLGIDVRDTGLGIPADKLDAIFEPFVQAGSDTTRHFGGTGLGLTISRNIARALGGDITVLSQPGKGSVFQLRVNPGSLEGVALVEQSQLQVTLPAPAEDTEMQWTFPNHTVLVVDDGESNRELLRVVLEQAGLQVAEARDGREAVHMALEKPYASILMDMQMPVMDGFTATRLLRKNGVNIPIIALTAHAMKGFEREILAVGCSGYLTKPVDIEALLTRLAKDLRGRRTRIAVPVRDETLVEHTLPIVSQGEPLVSRLSKHPKLREVPRKFAVQMRERLADMEHAWSERNHTVLAELAHWLKGSGGTAGFDAFTDPAARLVDLARREDVDGARRALSEIKRLVDRMVIPDDVVPAPSPDTVPEEML